MGEKYCIGWFLASPVQLADMDEGRGGYICECYSHFFLCITKGKSIKIARKQGCNEGDCESQLARQTGLEESQSDPYFLGQSL